MHAVLLLDNLVRLLSQVFTAQARDEAEEQQLRTISEKGLRTARGAHGAPASVRRIFFGDSPAKSMYYHKRLPVADVFVEVVCKDVASPISE